MEHRFTLLKKTALAVIIIMFFFLNEGIAQTESNTREGNCVILVFDFLAKKDVKIYSGVDQVEVIPFTDNKSRSYYNLITEALNKLYKEGYKITATVGSSYTLCKP